MRRFQLPSLLPLSLTLWFLVGCSLPWSKPAPQSNPTAASLVKEGDEALKNKSYKVALVQYERVRSEFPFSAEAKGISLKIAETYHLNKQYAEAIETYKEFLGFQPTNENVPYVLYQLGEVYLDQFKSIDRDKKIIEMAKSYYQTLAKEHPNSAYVPRAEEKIALCQRYLAEREYYVGEFYLKQEKYAAAKERFTNVVREYRNTSVAVKALYQLGETYRLEKNNVSATLAYESVIKYYPNNSLAEQARIQLSKLDKQDQDPLALLLLRDGRPAPEAPLPPASLHAAEQPLDHGDVKLVAKKAVDYEGGEKKKQGFFGGFVSAINPFDSSDDKANKKPPEEKKETAALNGASSGSSHSQGEPKKGFFRRIADSINPFASNDEKDNGAKSDGRVATSQNGSGTKGKGTNGTVVESIDRSLQQKGIQEPDGKAVFHSPIPELSQIPKDSPDTPPTDTKAVLGAIDSGLKTQGKENAAMPPPPEASPKLFSAPKKNKQSDDKTSPSPIAVLGAIDKGLEQKGVEVPAESRKPTDGTAAKTDVQTSSPPITGTQELSPRIGTADTPFLLDAGQFQWEEKPATAKDTKEPKQTVNPGNQPETTDSLSNAVLNDPWSTPPKKEEPKSDKKDPANEDPPEGVVDQLKQEAGNIKKILNPFGF